MDKNLKQKAVKIQGKDYVLVSDRVIFFNENYPEGCITTELIRFEDKQIIIKAVVYPEGVGEGKRFFTGYAQEIEGQGYINKTSALENAETSAVGRALAMMGIGVIDSIASVDEINKAKNREASEPFEPTGSEPIKTCPYCGKQHQGKFPKCMDCWKKEKDTGVKLKKQEVEELPDIQVDEPF